MLESNGKRLATITVQRIVAANKKSVNSCKAQHEKKCGKIKEAKDIRAEMLQELKNEIKEIKATDVIVVRDFNEDVKAKNQEFIAEMELYEVLVKFMK